MRSMQKKIGTIGENYFDSIIVKSGFISHKPSEDEFGWDRFLEYQMDSTQGPNDKKHIHLACYVQIKTSQDPKKSHPIKLSNWKSMIDKTDPFFVYSVILDNEFKVKKVFLSHIDETWMSQVLQKLRESSSDKLYQTSLSYRVKDYEEIDPDSSDSLKEKILQYIGLDIHRYAQKKIELRNTLGAPRKTTFQGYILPCFFFKTKTICSVLRIS